MKSNKPKILSLSALAVALCLPSTLIASTQNTPPLTEEEQKKPTVPQKVGKESARVVGQAKKVGKDIAHTFKKQRHKDKKKEKK